MKTFSIVKLETVAQTVLLSGMKLMTTIRRIACGIFIWSAAVVVGATPVEVTPAPTGGALQPQVSCDDQGRVFVVYGQGNDIFVAVSQNTDLHFQAASKVGKLPKLALGMRRGPRIATSGRALVVTAMNDKDLFAFHSEDAGRTWSAATRINGVAASAREGLGNLAAGPEGRFYATWLDLRSGAAEIYGALSRDGGKTWGANERVYRSPDGHVCECCHASVAFNARGDLVVMWRNALHGARDLWTVVLPAGSEQFDPPMRQGVASWKLEGCPMDGGVVFAQADNSFASVWQREGGVYLSTGPGKESNLGDGTQPVALAARGVVHVWWQRGAKLMHTTIGATEEPAVFAQEAKFASAAVSPKDGAVVVAFERTVSGRKTIFAEVLR